jgi:hypothetical protein
MSEILQAEIVAYSSLKEIFVNASKAAAGINRTQAAAIYLTGLKTAETARQ